MKLLKSTSVVVFLLSTSLCFSQWGNGKKIKGNGDITTLKRSTRTYEGIKAAGPMDFILVEGKEGDVSITGDSNLMEYIVTEIKKNILIVKVKEGFNLKPSETIVVTIPYETIETVSLTGSGDINNTGTIKANTFEVSLAGSGDISLTVSTQYIESNIAGSGDIALEGTAKTLTTKITGSGDFDGRKLKSTDVSAEITGSGSAQVNCTGNLEARITGSGDVKYSGTPTNKDTKITGSGSVKS